MKEFVKNPVILMIFRELKSHNFAMILHLVREGLITVKIELLTGVMVGRRLRGVKGQPCYHFLN